MSKPTNFYYYVQRFTETIQDIRMTPKDDPKRFYMLKRRLQKYLLKIQLMQNERDKKV